MVPGQPPHVAGNRPALSDDTAWPFSSSAQIDVSGLSHPGKVRSRNEDHFIVTRIGRYLETVLTTLPAGEVPERAEESGYVMIIADGMGGHAGGELASRMAISGLVKLVLAMPDWIFRLDESVAADATERSKQRFQQLHAALLEHGRQDGDVRGLGTTLTAARTMGRDLHVVHVGDSRAYLLRDARLHRLTRDHTYVQLLVDSGQLSQEEAAAFAARHVLVNALGGSNEDVEVDVHQLKLAGGDRLLLCSDGLTDVVDDETVRGVLIDSATSSEACHRLIDLALAGGGRDNVTVVVATHVFS
jgi:serine/threonine protein phosphatase PrpC